MRRAALSILVLLFSGPGWASMDALRADQSELLATWEEAQRSDPQTLLFERVEPGLYRFETERFPFAGDLRVLNVAINDQAYREDERLRMGIVEIELVDLPEEFLARHAHSYGFWMQTHLLYFDDEAGRWMSGEEWQQRVVGDPGSWCSPLVSLSGWFWIVMLLVLIVALSFAIRKANGQMKSAMSAQEKALSEQERAIRLTERALEIGEESNLVLKEILAALQRRPGSV